MFRLRTGVTYNINYSFDRYHDRWGVEVGRTEIIVYACPMTGRKYICGSHGNITLEKQWSPHPVPYALQATVKVPKYSLARYAALLCKVLKKVWHR